VTNDIDVNVEPLPGYRLIEHIGAGGYGEVWRAEAPGGLTKAIKFVFGQQHEKRASNEMRALERIRSVRHPFLLSLERIEVINGRLLVVSELADGSVKDRFDACRREGLHGIPRSELLGYLRDAADALDFMRDTHALQHLDIKPENLLLLAGHVKVADFGLVKDMRQSQASLVGGMTPLYAAPEVFRGAPSPHSDQYSLAIVYQEMLSGTLPFAGGNAAELTLQHLNDEPELTALSGSDRYAVSRALAKDPHLRYANCREFVDALLKAARPSTQFDEPAQVDGPFNGGLESPSDLSRQNLATDLFDDDACWHTAPEQMLVELESPEGSLVDLPPLESLGRDPRLAPTLVLGIGGAAGRVLCHFRRMINNQFGSGSQLPAVQFLLLDTDPRALGETARHDESGLLPDETLNLPLRRPQHYREHSQQLLNWLSRRWLYNIPRSLRTEGLRPLGRLALTDHARQTGQRIRRAISQALEADAVAVTAQATQQPFRNDAVRVFVVASISGGTGSGMSIDVGYMVRAVLEKLQLSTSRITGVMMHSTGGDPRHTELARVNAYAWLSEFQHFAQPNNLYPGDASCGLPPHPAGMPPFDHTYLVHLGENLDQVEFDQAAQCVAEYLQLNVLTPASAFFDACRESHEQEPQIDNVAKGQLRSFGIYRRTAAPSELCDQFAALVTEQVLSSWRPVERTNAPGTSLNAVLNSAGLPADAAGGSQLAANASQLVRRLQLDSSGIAANARSLVELQLGGDATNFLSSWFAKQSSTREAGEHVQLQAIDRIFGVQPAAGDGRKIFLLGQLVSSIVQPLDEKLRSEIRRWISARIDDPRERLAGARRALAWMTGHLGECGAELERLRRTVVAKLDEIREEATAAARSSSMGSEATSRDTFSRRVLDYFRLRLDQLAISAAEHTVHLILSDAKSMSDEITALGREIDQIAAAASRTAAAQPHGRGRDEADSAAAGAQAGLMASLQAKLPELIGEVDRRLQTDYVSAHGGLLALVMQGGRPRAQLGAKLHELARQAVHRVLNGINVLADAAGHAGSQQFADLRSGLAMATPSVVEFGGRRRVLAILPRDSANSEFAAMLSHSLGIGTTSIAGSDNSITLCVEAERLSIQHIAVNFVQRRRDRVDFAERVHCRTDINWTPLVVASATPAPVVWNSVRESESHHTISRQDMCKTLVM
jgi:serine/threonine protein kinase